MNILESALNFLIPANLLSVVSLIILLSIFLWGVFIKIKSLKTHRETIQDKLKESEEYSSAPPEVFIKLVERELHSNFLLKAVPSTLVSLGVMATFIGLGIAIMDASSIINVDETPDPVQLLEVLNVISFKFQTSVYGIFLSVIFNFSVVKPYIKSIEELEENVALELYKERQSPDEIFSTLKDVIQELQSINGALNYTLTDLEHSIRETSELANDQNIQIKETLEHGLRHISKSTSRLDESMKEILSSTTDELTAITKESAGLQKDLKKAISVGLESIDDSVKNMDHTLNKSQEETNGIIENMETSMTRQNQISEEFKDVMNGVDKNISELAKASAEIALLSKEKEGRSKKSHHNPMNGIS